MRHRVTSGVYPSTAPTLPDTATTLQWMAEIERFYHYLRRVAGSHAPTLPPDWGRLDQIPPLLEQLTGRPTAHRSPHRQQRVFRQLARVIDEEVAARIAEGTTYRPLKVYHYVDREFAEADAAEIDRQLRAGLEVEVVTLGDLAHAHEFPDVRLVDQRVLNLEPTGYLDDAFVQVDVLAASRFAPPDQIARAYNVVLDTLDEAAFEALMAALEAHLPRDGGEPSLFVPPPPDPPATVPLDPTIYAVIAAEATRALREREQAVSRQLQRALDPRTGPWHHSVNGRRRP